LRAGVKSVLNEMTVDRRHADQHEGRGRHRLEHVQSISLRHRAGFHVDDDPIEVEEPTGLGDHRIPSNEEQPNPWSITDEPLLRMAQWVSYIHGHSAW
jgi:hypothetical protein